MSGNNLFIQQLIYYYNILLTPIFASSQNFTQNPSSLRSFYVEYIFVIHTTVDQRQLKIIRSTKTCRNVMRTSENFKALPSPVKK